MLSLKMEGPQPTKREKLKEGDDSTVLKAFLQRAAKRRKSKGEQKLL